MPESLTFCGRTFRTGELELIRQTAREFSALGVTEIACTVCEMICARLMLPKSTSIQLNPMSGGTPKSGAPKISVYA